jgi:hypothetical protein
MTSEKSYFVKFLKSESRLSRFTLYEAVKVLVAAHANGEDVDAALVCRASGRGGVGRAVAFLSLWSETIRPIYSAKFEERIVLAEMEGPQVRPL